MEACIESRNEFQQRYWNYYLILEKDFLETERYLAIDELNFNAYSNEYIKQYQAICSEIDVIAKSFCKKLDCSFSGNNINTYCKCILDNVSDFPTRIIKVNNRDIQIHPWENWSYSTETDSKGYERIIANNPEWWKIYNKAKHDRTTINTETGLPYYKLANQKNVIYSLSALFQLELYYYRKLHQMYFHTEPDMPDNSSELFIIENWGNTWITAGNLCFEIENR